MLQRTFVTDCINKRVVKNQGELPMYHVKNNHVGIVPKELFQRVQEEMTRRTSKRKVMQKSGKTEQGKYSAKYTLSELLVCGECGTPYKRCTWSRNGKKRIVWRCVSRLEFGRKYCHNSPTLDEDKLHNAIVAALKRYGADRAKGIEDTLAITGIVQSQAGEDGVSLLDLQGRLKELSAEQAVLLDKVLEDMDNPELNAQLKTLAEEKQSILDQIAAFQEDEEQQTLRISRQRERDEWLEQRQLDWLEQRPYTPLFVSGNHENYDLLAEYPVEDWNGGQVYDIQGKKFFTMGGASSHDISGGFYKADALTDFLDEITQRCQFRYHCFGHYHTNTVIRKNMFCCMSRLST